MRGPGRKPGRVQLPLPQTILSQRLGRNWEPQGKALTKSHKSQGRHSEDGLDPGLEPRSQSPEVPIREIHVTK